MHTAEITTGKIWQATGELRWNKRPGASVMGIATFERVLQQKWLCHDNGETYWRDVPEEYVP